MNSKNKHIIAIKKYIESDEQCLNLFNSIVPNFTINDIVDEIDKICKTILHSEMTDIFYQYFSVGYSLGIQLKNDNKVHIKILNTSRENLESLKFKIEYQDFLSKNNIKTPIYLSPPLSINDQLFLITEFNQNGSFVDTQKPEYRKAMAHELHKINSCFDQFPNKNISLYELISDDISAQGWSKPHNSLFDFNRHREETYWINKKMYDSLEVIKEYSEYDKKIISHTDWTGKHFRFNNYNIEIIYDWDSLRYMSLYRCISAAALTFPYNDEIGNIKFSDLNDLFCFLAEYQESSNSKFNQYELTLISAYCTYISSYVCKCLCTMSEDKNSIAYMESFEISRILKEAKNGLFFEINNYIQN